MATQTKTQRALLSVEWVISQRIWRRASCSASARRRANRGDWHHICEQVQIARRFANLNTDSFIVKIMDKIKIKTSRPQTRPTNDYKKLVSRNIEFLCSRSASTSFCPPSTVRLYFHVTYPKSQKSALRSALRRTVRIGLMMNIHCNLVDDSGDEWASSVGLDADRC